MSIVLLTRLHDLVVHIELFYLKSLGSTLGFSSHFRSIERQVLCNEVVAFELVPDQEWLRFAKIC